MNLSIKHANQLTRSLGPTFIFFQEINEEPGILLGRHVLWSQGIYTILLIISRDLRTYISGRQWEMPGAHLSDSEEPTFLNGSISDMPSMKNHTDTMR